MVEIEIQKYINRRILDPKRKKSRITKKLIGIMCVMV